MHSLKQELHFEIIACVATGLVTRYMSGILVVHPNLQAGEGGRGSVGGGGSHLDPELRRGPGVKKKNFGPLGLSLV